jgi:hypothetical protein
MIPWTASTRLDPYELVSPIGAGGMGEVWKARDTRLDRVVAVKRLAGGSTVGTSGEDPDDCRSSERVESFAVLFSAIRQFCASLQLKARTRRLWLRAPLLVLLLAWFLVGFAGGIFSMLARNY